MRVTRTWFHLSLGSAHVIDFINAVAFEMTEHCRHYEWFIVRSFGELRCTDCGVPFVDSELVFWHATDGIQWASESNDWICFQCAYDRCVAEDGCLPPVPEGMPE